MILNKLKDYEVSTEKNVSNNQYIIRLKEVHSNNIKYVTAANSKDTLDTIKYALKTLEV